MNRRWILGTLCLGWLTVTAHALTPGEVFEDGRRAFLLGHFRAAFAHFAEFQKRWPGHPLGDQGLLYLSQAEIRMEKELDEEYRAARLASFTSRLKYLKTKFEPPALIEIGAAVELLQAQMSGKLASPGYVLALPPATLEHFLSRGWLPFPQRDPMGALTWLREWMARHPLDQHAALLGRLELYRAKALWQILVSPLPRRANMPILESWGDWPVPDTLLRSLKRAFQFGAAETKREAALLGVCTEELVLRGRQVSGEDSPWIRYLKERGIHEAEAWCPSEVDGKGEP